MSELGRVRLRLPSVVKAGDVVRVRCLVIHTMERLERDASGRIVDRTYRYIDQATVTYRGRTIATFDTTQSVSENPILGFTFKATAPGQLSVTFRDTHGGRFVGTIEVRLG